MIAARIRNSSLPSDAWKASAAPWKVVITLAGRPMSVSALRMAFTASPSEAPGARLNETVVAGKLAEVVDRERRGRVDTLAISAESGTCPPTAVEEGR